MTRLGATGKYPEGKIVDSDEGEISIAVGHMDRRVIIDFGTPTSWLGMPIEQAREFANAVHRRADMAERQQGGRLQEDDSH